MRCINCHRDSTIVTITKHHLIPKVKGGRKEAIALLCEDCHRFLNSQFTENEQRDLLNTEEKLKANERMKNFSKFAKKQKGRKVKMKDSSQRRRKRRK